MAKVAAKNTQKLFCLFKDMVNFLKKGPHSL